MKYYLVALFDKDSYSAILHIQKIICKKYKIYYKPLKPHLTFEVIENPDMDKLDKLILKILHPYKKFKVNLNKTLCCDELHKSVNLIVENKGYIIRIARNIHDTLKLAQFNIIENKTAFNLNIFLGKTNSHSLDFLNNRHIPFSSSTSSDNYYNFIKISKIELWKCINANQNTVVKTYDLRDY